MVDTRNHHTAAPKLRDYVLPSHGRRIDWEAVERRVASHPHEAADPLWDDDDDPLHHPIIYHPLHSVVEARDPPASLRVVRAVHDAFPGAFEKKSPLGQTILHEAASNGQMEADVVEFLLRRHPEAAAIKDRSDRTPLHFVRSGEVGRTLVSAYPAALGQKDVKGSIPLNRACNLWPYHTMIDVVSVLLEDGWRQQVGGGDGGGGVLTEDNEGTSPLSLICKRWISEHKKGGGEGGNGSVLWGGLTLLARAAYSARERMDRIDAAMEPTLCCVIRLVRDVPSDLASYIVLCGGSEVGTMLITGSRGRTPLHFAAQYLDTQADVIDVLLDTEGGREMARVMNRSTDGVCGLGRLPLHLAAENTSLCYEGLSRIANAEPRALKTKDATTNLYPFMMAAVGEDSRVESVYFLLQEVPFLIEQCASKLAGADAG